MMSHRNCVPHYTVLWARGLVWGGSAPSDGGVPPPATGGVPPPNGGNFVR
jgi:hypothetical protein